MDKQTEKMHRLQKELETQPTCEKISEYAKHLGVRDMSDEGMGWAKQNFDVRTRQKYDELQCVSKGFPKITWNGQHEK
jgi:hypothetical protein